MSNAETINRYRYRFPAAEEAKHALARMFGPEDALTHWEAACDLGGVVPDDPDLGPDDLRRVADALISGGGLASIVGRTLTIRLVTYSSLAATEADHG
ncbi:MAG: hypothetical protein K0V04_42435 [Deltaproteobacteria bacterium]|nr:hypothetical protein [Deltaproteobacteria bacterium]